MQNDISFVMKRRAEIGYGEPIIVRILFIFTSLVNFEVFVFIKLRSYRRSC